MRLLIPLTLEMDDTKEPPEAVASRAVYCPVCFAVIPGHLLGRHLQVAHPEWSGE
jgi:hypothetical protein